MSTDPFSLRMAEIRKRFAVKLAAKIEETESILADLAGASALEAAKATYQRFHEMAGIAPTIGFVETGNAARALDAILIGPYRAGRALTPDELIKVRAGLETLRAAAGAEMKSLAAECLP